MFAMNLKIKIMNINRSKHVWEGWTVGDFIQEIEPIFNIVKTNIKTKEELKTFVKYNQPYYKKHIPEVYRYFLNKTNIK
jgi:predicted restriction endonuclease